MNTQKYLTMGVSEPPTMNRPKAALSSFAISIVVSCPATIGAVAGGRAGCSECRDGE